MIEIINRLFSNWQAIHKDDVPHWIRRKLWKQKYVKYRGREYKIFHDYYYEKYDYSHPGMSGMQPHPYPNPKTRRINTHEYFYRDLV